MPVTWTYSNMLGYGGQDICRAPDDSGEAQDYALVHACKHPCHQSCVGYAKTLPKTHPHYLSARKGNALYLNLIDPPVPLFQIESFDLFFAFVDEHLHKRPLLIHCNQGLSRAPSLTLLVMAKRLGALPDTDYTAARNVFAALYPYDPGKGIATFLDRNWDRLGYPDARNRQSRTSHPVPPPTHGSPR